MENLKKIKGDASFRKFYRKKNNGYNSIVVLSKREKLKNLLIYDAINKVLIKNKILAPKLYHENYNKNIIEIEDFGNNTIFKIPHPASAAYKGGKWDAKDVFNKVNDDLQNQGKSLIKW